METEEVGSNNTRRQIRDFERIDKHHVGGNVEAGRPREYPEAVDAYYRIIRKVQARRWSNTNCLVVRGDGDFCDEW